MPSGQLTGYNTFFQNNKSNFNMNYQNSSRVNNNMVIEEDAEYRNNTNMHKYWEEALITTKFIFDIIIIHIIFYFYKINMILINKFKLAKKKK